MSVEGRNKTLVLGGIRSGKPAYAEALLSAAATVRSIATSRPPTDDPQWQARIDAHRDRRPTTSTTEEAGDDPPRHSALPGSAQPEDPPRVAAASAAVS